MPQKTHTTAVRKWCQSLAVLSAISMTRDEAEMRLAAFVPLLAQRFPTEAFTTDSLEHCAARASKGFPTYGELTACLAAWWREQRDGRYPALPAPSVEPHRPNPTDDDIAAVEAAARRAIAYLHSQILAAPYPKPIARCLPPAVLDAINPLPNGYSRVQGRVIYAPQTASDEATGLSKPLDVVA